MDKAVLAPVILSPVCLTIPKLSEAYGQRQRVTVEHNANNNGGSKADADKAVTTPAPQTEIGMQAEGNQSQRQRRLQVISFHLPEIMEAAKRTNAT